VPGLLWSPRALRSVISEISAARHSVLFTSEELGDADVFGALAADARRGVACYVVMTYNRSWRTGLAALLAAGCHVHVGADRRGQVYFHIKRLVVDAGSDAATVLLGSQNASRTSLERNRELSLRLSRGEAPHVVAAVTATFWRDYRGASAWTG
jgi:phosphatidylserine/phosphatidylglycerophosphate/cardiolipin synthase-like enzyme